MAGAGAKPSPGPLLPIPGRTLMRPFAWGSQWAASSPPSLRPTPYTRVGGWGDRSLSQERYQALTLGARATPRVHHTQAGGVWHTNCVRIPTHPFATSFVLLRLPASLASLEVFDIKAHAHHAQLYGFFRFSPASVMARKTANRRSPRRRARPAKRRKAAAMMGPPLMQLDAARPWASWDRPLLGCEANRRRQWSCR